MELKLPSLQDKRALRRFEKFVYKLYKDDCCFVDTSLFLLRDFLYKKTEFARECDIIPLAVYEGERRLAQCLLMVHKNLPMLQVSFFEAVSNADAAVGLLIDQAKKRAAEKGLKKIVIGLNGHISYGVGILTDNYHYRNSFDSIYNRSYYGAYFDKLSQDKQTLSTYRTFFERPEAAVAKYRDGDCAGVNFRTLDMRDFENEMTAFGELCDATIGETNLYFPTSKTHMYELVKEMKFFLKPENFIFAEHNGKLVGFVFWHPDFNRILRTGGKNSLLSIAAAYLAREKNIDTVKLNSVGVLPEYQSGKLIMALLGRALAQMRKRKVCRYIETNFVWDNNAKSTLLNRHLLGEAHRHYAVWYLDV